MNRCLFVGWERFGPLDHVEFAVRGAREDGGVEAEERAAPPVTVEVFFIHRGEPVLPEHGANVFRRRVREGIALEKGKDVGIAFKEALFGEGDDFGVLEIGEEANQRFQSKRG